MESEDGQFQSRDLESKQLLNISSYK